MLAWLKEIRFLLKILSQFIQKYFLNRECRHRGLDAIYTDLYSMSTELKNLLRYSENLQANMPQSLPFIC